MTCDSELRSVEDPGQTSTGCRGCLRWCDLGPAADGKRRGLLCAHDPARHMYSLDVAAGETLWTFASGGSCLSGAAISEERLSGARVTRSSAPRNNKLYSFDLPGYRPRAALAGWAATQPARASIDARTSTPPDRVAGMVRRGRESPSALRIAAFSKPRPSGRVDALSTPGIPADPTETGTECGVLPPLLDLVRDPWDDGCCASRLADLVASTPVTTPSVRVAPSAAPMPGAVRPLCFDGE
jgi:hypothetical protein